MENDVPGGPCGNYGVTLDMYSDLNPRHWLSGNNCHRKITPIGLVSQTGRAFLLFDQFPTFNRSFQWHTMLRAAGERAKQRNEWASVLQLQLQNHWHWLPALSRSCDCNWTKPQTKTFHYFCFGSMHSVKEKNKTGSIILLSPYFFSGKLKFQFWSGPKSSFKSSSE